MTVLRVALAVPDAHQARARYAFRELATRWGLSLRLVAAGEPCEIAYGGEARAADGALVRLPFDAALYEPATRCEPLRTSTARTLWVRAGVGEPAAADLVAATFRLLTYLDESAIPEAERDRRGIFRTDALPPGRREALGVPLVEHHADELLQRLLRAQPALAAARVPRWPSGCRLAVAASHDVDAVQLGAPGELATNLAKAVLRRNATHWALFSAGLAAMGRPLADPYFSFARWQAWESARGLTSAFYVYHRPPGTPRDLNDCKSSLAELAIDWAPLRRLADQGWEFGLHPSIHCKDTPGAFAAARAWLGGKLGREVVGLRHHYWALDWRDPVATHRLHEQAGFRYDSSIAWRERAGFRAGTALPYRPFDASAGRELALVELPCVLMDGHILLGDASGRRTAPAEAIAMGQAAIAEVRAVDGLLTTNWHSETIAGQRLHEGYMATLGALMAPLVGASDVWRATPAAIARHWRERTAGLVGE